MPLEFNNKIHKKILLVEGHTDAEIVSALMYKYHLSFPSFYIKSCRGKDSVRKMLKNLLKAHDCPNQPQSIGIIVDSDASILDEYLLLQDTLVKFGYPSRTLPNEGLILRGSNKKPRIGLWLMPNNSSEGNLENFCLDLIKTTNKEKVLYLKEQLLIARELDYASFKDIHLSKALLYTYLACQDKPVQSLGLAVASGAIPPFPDLAEKFIRWMKSVFQRNN